MAHYILKSFFVFFDVSVRGTTKYIVYLHIDKSAWITKLNGRSLVQDNILVDTSIETCKML